MILNPIEWPWSAREIAEAERLARKDMSEANAEMIMRDAARVATTYPVSLYVAVVAVRRHMGWLG